MGDTRIRYGLALGRQNNWYSGLAQKGYLAGTEGLLAQANTAPDVTMGVLFYTANSASTTITNLQLSAPGNPGGNIAPLFEGKVIKVFFTDSNTTLTSGTRIFLADTASMPFPANSWVGLVYHNSAWYETERTVQNIGSIFERTLYVGLTQQAITATNKDRILYIQATAEGVVISGISGGYEGQRLTLAFGGSGAGNIQLGNATSSGWGNIFFLGTNQVTLAVAGSAGTMFGLDFIKLGTAWHIPAKM